jgi:hypothetical protein
MRDPSEQGPGARLSGGLECQVKAGFGNGQPAPGISPRRPALTQITPTATRQQPQPRDRPHRARFSGPRGARPGDMWLSGIGLDPAGEPARHPHQVIGNPRGTPLLMASGMTRTRPAVNNG